MVLRRGRIARMTDAGELCRLARKDEPDVAQAAMDRMVDLLGTRQIRRSDLAPADLRWLGLATRLRLREAQGWRESLAVLRAIDIFEAQGGWYVLLSQLMTGEVTIACPGCGLRLILRRSHDGLGLVIINGVVHDVAPADPGSLDRSEQDCHRTVSAERPDLGLVLLQLFSPLVCPGCGTRSRLALHSQDP